MILTEEGLNNQLKGSVISARSAHVRYVVMVRGSDIG